MTNLDSFWSLINCFNWFWPHSTDLTCFEPFWPVFFRFDKFWTVLPIWTHFGLFGSNLTRFLAFWPNFYHFSSIWTICFDSYWPIVTYFKLFSLVFTCLYPFSPAYTRFNQFLPILLALTCLHPFLPHFTSLHLFQLFSLAFIGVSVILSPHIERFSVSRMPDIKKIFEP